MRSGCAASTPSACRASRTSGAVFVEGQCGEAEIRIFETASIELLDGIFTRADVEWLIFVAVSHYEHARILLKSLSALRVIGNRPWSSAGLPRSLRPKAYLSWCSWVEGWYK